MVIQPSAILTSPSAKYTSKTCHLKKNVGKLYILCIFNVIYSEFIDLSIFLYLPTLKLQ